MAVDGNWQQAEAHHRAGRVELARTLYAGLADKPAYAPWAGLRLASIELAAGRLREATRHALEAHALAYAEPSLLLQCCRQLLALGEVQAGLAAAKALAALGRVPVPALAEGAKLLSDHMQPEAALALLARLGEDGRALGPGVDYLRGLNLVYAGELEAGAGALQRSLAIDPGFAPAYWSLAKLRLGAGRSERIDRLRARLHAIGDAHADAPLLLYSLFHELDAEDEVESAWSTLERAMATRRAQVHYDEGAQEAMCAALVESMPRLARRTASSAAPAPPPVPLFVVGMPRTGTTVIEQWLCRRYALRSAGEPRDLARQMRWVADLPGAANPDLALVEAMEYGDLDLLGRRYLGHTQWMAGAMPRYADKWPENYLLLGFALAAIPQARAIIVQREPMDSCWSNMKEWFGGSYFYSYDAQQTARQYTRFRRLAQAAGEAFGARVKVVEYERFVRDPQPEGAALASHAGLSRRDAGATAPATTPVATASAAQVRGEVSTQAIGAWRRYARWLGPAMRELERAGWGIGA